MVTGHVSPPDPDEGIAAHVFQMSIALLVPFGFAFLATADWKQPVRSMRQLAVPPPLWCWRSGCCSISSTSSLQRTDTHSRERDCHFVFCEMCSRRFRFGAANRRGFGSTTRTGNRLRGSQHGVAVCDEPAPFPPCEEFHFRSGADLANKLVERIRFLGMRASRRL